MFVWVFFVAIHLLKSFADGSSKLPSCSTKNPFDWVGLNRTEKETILSQHNRLRKQILEGKIDGLPKAKHMKKIKWDEALEVEAEKWVKMCPGYTDGTAHPPQDWKSFSYGQNVAWAHLNHQNAVQDWFDEYKPYVSAGASPLLFRQARDPLRRRLGQLAHFTAMAHAETDRMGCSAAGGTNYQMRVVLVCNYAPPGNVMVRGNDGSLESLPAYQVDNATNIKKDDRKTEWTPKFRKFDIGKSGRPKRNSQIKVVKGEKRRIEYNVELLKKEKDFLTRFIESVMGPNLENLYKLQH